MYLDSFDYNTIYMLHYVQISMFRSVYLIINQFPINYWSLSSLSDIIITSPFGGLNSVMAGLTGDLITLDDQTFLSVPI